MNYKKGDNLYCHTTLIMDDSNDIALTKGKIYKIHTIGEDDDNKFTIFNNYHIEHIFSFNVNYHSYYKQWFDDVKIMRRKKLKIINSLST